MRQQKQCKKQVNAFGSVDIIQRCFILESYKHETTKLTQPYAFDNEIEDKNKTKTIRREHRDE